MTLLIEKLPKDGPIIESIHRHKTAYLTQDVFYTMALSRTGAQCYMMWNS